MKTSGTLSRFYLPSSWIASAWWESSSARKFYLAVTICFCRASSLIISILLTLQLPILNTPRCLQPEQNARNSGDRPSSNCFALPLTNQLLSCARNSLVELIFISSEHHVFREEKQSRIEIEFGGNGWFPTCIAPHMHSEFFWWLIIERRDRWKQYSFEIEPRDLLLEDYYWSTTLLGDLSDLSGNCSVTYRNWNLLLRTAYVPHPLESASLFSLSNSSFSIGVSTFP